MANAGYERKGRETKLWERVALGAAVALLLLPMELLNALGFAPGAALLISRDRRKP